MPVDLMSPVKALENTAYTVKAMNTAKKISENNNEKLALQKERLETEKYKAKTARKRLNLKIRQQREANKKASEIRDAVKSQKEAVAQKIKNLKENGGR